MSAEISARIQALEAQLAETAGRVQRVPDLHALHEQFTRTEVGGAMEALEREGDTEELRDLVQELVTSARIIERRPESHPTWPRVEVTWSETAGRGGI